MSEADRYLAVAKRYQPKGVSIRFRTNGWLWPAHAIQHADDTREIYAPYPDTRAKLYVWLHEVAHVVLGHIKPTDKTPVWKMEYEAEMWAIATMRREGIPVPRDLLREAKRYVREEIDRETKLSVPAHIRRWAPTRCRRWKKLDHKNYE